MFPLLVVVDHAAVNVGRQISGRVSASPRVCTPGSGDAKQRLIPCLLHQSTRGFTNSVILFFAAALKDKHSSLLWLQKGICLKQNSQLECLPKGTWSAGFS